MSRTDLENESAQLTQLCRTLSDARDIASKLTLVRNAGPLIRAISVARIAANEMAVKIEQKMDRMRI